jgi:uncharacterized protein
LRNAKETVVKRIIGFLACIAVVGCGDDHLTTIDTFNRPQMLQNVMSTLILPAYASLETECRVLDSLITVYSAELNQKNLLQAQEQWKRASMAWMQAISYDFGPADGLLGNLSMNIGTFPTNKEQINIAIQTSDTLLNNFQRDARGLPALEYLLFDSAAQQRGQDTQVSNARSAYIRAVSRNILREVQSVHNQWNSGYGQQFIANSGSDAGSSVSLLFNNLSMSFEWIKNFKIATPLGKRAGQTGTDAMLAEAPYSDISIGLMSAHFRSVMQIWALAFKPYLQTVEGGAMLVTSTEAQQNAIELELQRIANDSFEEHIRNNPTRYDNVYIEMQKMTRYLKSEMSSVLGISITYSSGDGD